MGAMDDTAVIYGNDLTDEAIRKHFDETVESRLYGHGHNGYSGTMAESNGSFDFFDKIFEDEEEAREYVIEHSGKQNPHGFFESFSSKNYTNCARFKGEDGEGAVYGGSYSY
jgi:hypothetical protein